MSVRAAAAALAAAVMLGLLLARGAPRSRPDRPIWVFLSPAALDTTDSPLIAGQPRRRPPPTRDDPAPSTEALHAVVQAGGRVRTVSRWLRAISVDADHRAVTRIAALPFVTRIQPVGRLRAAGAEPGRSLPPRALSRSVQDFDSAYYGANWATLRDLGIPSAHAFGFTGMGVVIGILDTGFETRHESVNGTTILAQRDFIGGDGNVRDQPGDPGSDQALHGTRVWSLVGATAPGRLVGTAPGASYLLAKVDMEPGDRQADEDRWVAAVEWAESRGVDVLLSGVAFRSDFVDKPDYAFGVLNGDITVTTRVADEAARRGVLIVTPIGNDGPSIGTLAAPADADSVIAVGAVDALGEPALFIGGGSARGPTADGRVKPELAAVAVNLVAAGNASLGAYDRAIAGTSYAAALIAGGAALVVQAWPSLDAMAVRQALLLAGSEAASPDNGVGWGRPDVAAAILMPEGISPVSAAEVDLQGALTTVAPTFSWSAPLVHPAMRPVRYRLEISTDPVFNGIVHSDTASDASSLTLRQPLDPASALWWRVIAEAGEVRRTSGVAGPIRMPSWVRLIAPTSDRVTFVKALRPEFSWQPLAAPPPIGPLTYDIEVFSNLGRTPLQAGRGLTQPTFRLAQPLEPNVAYGWRVITRTRTGQIDTVESSALFVVTSDTLPPATLLYQNFPNPFPRADLGRTTTSVWFDLAETSVIELSVHDQRGRLVRRLIPADPSCGRITAGPGQFGRGAPSEPTGDCLLTVWDGRDADGETVPRGVYVLRLLVDGQPHYRRIIFAPE
jgi:serine protease AprX